MVSTHWETTPTACSRFTSFNSPAWRAKRMAGEDVTQPRAVVRQKTGEGVSRCVSTQRSVLAGHAGTPITKPFPLGATTSKPSACNAAAYAKHVSLLSDVSSLAAVNSSAADWPLVRLFSIGTPEAPSLVNACACRKSNPDILMMQPAQDGTAKNVTDGPNGTRYWRVLI